MTILGTIMAKLLGKAPASAATPAPGGPSAQARGTVPSAPTPASSPPLEPSDLAAALDALSGKRSERLGEKFDWRHSTPDLMRVLSVEYSVLARQELAKELHYEGDTNNSAARDIWLHEQIMAILAANGGKLPVALRRRWYLSHYGP